VKRIFRFNCGSFLATSADVLDGAYCGSYAIFLIGGITAGGAGNDADRRLYANVTGSTVHVLRVNEEADNALVPRCVLRLRDMCCGLALDPSGNHFYTFLARRKVIGKYDLDERVRYTVHRMQRFL